jgi:site-specific recombinase
MLGVLLAVAPGVGRLFGLPLDVRHVTLSFGALAFPGCALGPEAVVHPEFLAALLGVLGTGALNFGVSFALAIVLRAQDASPSDGLRLVRMLTSRFLRQPRSFLLSPRNMLGSMPIEESAPIPRRSLYLLQATPRHEERNRKNSIQTEFLFTVAT